MKIPRMPTFAGLRSSYNGQTGERPPSGGRHRLEDNPTGRRPTRGAVAVAVPRGAFRPDEGEGKRYKGSRRSRTGARPLPEPADPFDTSGTLRRHRTPSVGSARGRFGPPPMPTRQSPSDLPDRHGGRLTRREYEEREARDRYWREQAERDRENRRFMEETDREMRAQARRQTGRDIERGRRRREVERQVDEELGRRRYRGKAAAPARPLPGAGKSRRGGAGSSRAVPESSRYPELHGRDYSGGSGRRPYDPPPRRPVMGQPR